MTQQPVPEGPPASTYLWNPARSDGYTWLLVALALYQIAGMPTAAYQFSALLFLGLAVALVLKAHRWPIYVLLITLATIGTAQTVFVEANGPQDAQADRDETVETAARAFLARANPWTQHTPMGNNITTGPASLLIAAPFVKIWGRVDGLTFLFWLGLLGFLLMGDLAHQNDSFLNLALFYLLGQFEVARAQYWSLEELYFPQLMIAGAFLATRGGRHVVVGALLAVAVMCRTNYVFLVVAFLLWFWRGARGGEGRAWIRLAVGGAVAAITVLLIIGVRCDFGTFDDYLRVTSAVAGQPLADVPMTAPARAASWILGTKLGPPLMGLVALALIVLAGCRLPRWHHPFRALALASFLAQTLVWYPARAMDYTLVWAIPLLFSIGWRDRDITNAS